VDHAKVDPALEGRVADAASASSARHDPWPTASTGGPLMPKSRRQGFYHRNLFIEPPRSGFKSD